MITPDDFRCRYPEFEDSTEYSDARINLFIADAQDDIGADEGHWGSTVRYDRALAALTAHMLVAGEASESGDYSPLQAIASKSAGGVKIAHVQSSKTAPKSTYENMLKSTTYGQNFLAMRRRTFVSVSVVET